MEAKPPRLMLALPYSLMLYHSYFGFLGTRFGEFRFHVVEAG